jgi:hypothetical protein
VNTVFVSDVAIQGIGQKTAAPLQTGTVIDKFGRNLVDFGASSKVESGMTCAILLFQSNLS